MRKALTVMIVVATLIAAIFIQINFLNKVPLFGVVSNIGIIIIAGLGLINGKLIGGISGAFYGIIIDIIFGKIIGIYLALYTLVGVFTGQISNKFSKENRTSMVMIVAITTAIFEFASYIILSLLQGNSIALIQPIIIIAIEVVYNFLLTVILYRLVVGLGEIINKGKNSYYLL